MRARTVGSANHRSIRVWIDLDISAPLYGTKDKGRMTNDEGFGPWSFVLRQNRIPTSALLIETAVSAMTRQRITALILNHSALRTDGAPNT